MPELPYRTERLPYRKILFPIHLNSTLFAGEYFCNHCGKIITVEVHSQMVWYNCFPYGVPDDLKRLAKEARRYLAILETTLNMSHVRPMQCLLTVKESHGG